MATLIGFDPSNLEIRTKSIEQTLVPLVTQVRYSSNYFSFTFCYLWRRRAAAAASRALGRVMRLENSTRLTLSSYWIDQLLFMLLLDDVGDFLRNITLVALSLTDYILSTVAREREREKYETRRHPLIGIFTECMILLALYYSS